MRKNASVSIIHHTVEKYGSDKKKLTAELKRLVKDGRKSGDLLMIGAGLHTVFLPKPASTSTMKVVHFQTPLRLWLF